MVTPLPENTTEVLRTARFTYQPVGATASSPPPGYHHFTRTRLLTHTDLATAGERLFTWCVHEHAGLQVAASSQRAEPETVVLMRLGMRRLSLRIPCRVVYVVDEPHRLGFAYGTLPGHPESGEELFLLERDHLERVTFTVAAFSKPASLLARVGGPATQWTQQWMTSRYLDGIDQT